MESSTYQNKNQNYENKELEQLIAEGNNYVSIKDGETRVLQFTPEKTDIVQKLDFNGKPTKRVQFVAFEINDPNMREKKFELSSVHAGKIYEHLKRGSKVLEISRLGNGKDTRYFIKAVQ
jgi:hypothetical protein